MNLRAITKTAVDAIFTLGTDFVQDATYIRPVSFSPGTGLSAANESSAAIRMLIADYRSRESNLLAEAREKILIRASELTTITSPAAGDYIIQSSDGQRRDVLDTQLDLAGEFWTFQTIRSLNQDWGDLTPHTIAEDFGDLTTVTTSDDFGTLFPS